MAEQILWLDGEANVGKEKICPGRHVKQNEWQSTWNKEYRTPRDKNCYDYISDYECIFNHPLDPPGNNDLQNDQKRWQNLQAAKKQGMKVSITNLAHFTKPGPAKQICKTNGFIGGEKKINQEKNGNRVTNIKARLSWWSPILTSEDIKQVRDHLGNAIQPFLEEGDNLHTLQNQFASSDAFLPHPKRIERLYGLNLFQYGINELCQYYHEQICDDVQYKVLGTFGYKQEVMHAVLVCSKTDGAGQFAAYPEVPADVNNEAVIIRDKEGKWVWKPQATATEITRLQALERYPMYRRWEHVAFAFHLPDDMIMKCEQPADHHKILTEEGTIRDHLPEDDLEEDEELR